MIAPNINWTAYVDLAEDAANIDPPKSPKLKTKSEWRYLGKSQPHLDQLSKATGTADFGKDTRLQGMLFATIRMTPSFGVRIDEIEATNAKSMPGVKKIVSWDDGFGVIATNTWLAKQAAEAEEVTWSKGNAPENTEAAFAIMQASFKGSPNVEIRNQGDIEDALSNGKIIARTYHAPFLTHASIEPMNGTALFQDGKLDLWAGNQAPHLLRDACAHALDMSKHNVNLHTPSMDGLSDM